MKPAFYFGLGSWIISGFGSLVVVGSFVVVLLLAIPHGGGNSNFIVIQFDELLKAWLSVVYSVLLCATGLLLVLSFASAYYKRLA
jgi:hypothetical protein